MTTAKQKLEETRRKYPKQPEESKPQERKMTARQKLDKSAKWNPKGYDVLDEFM